MDTYGQVLVTNYRDFVLLGWDASGQRIELETYRPIRPALDLGLPYMPARVDTDYLSGLSSPTSFLWHLPDVKTSRDDVVVDIDRVRLVQCMEQYFDPALSHEERGAASRPERCRVQRASRPRRSAITSASVASGQRTLDIIGE